MTQPEAIRSTLLTGSPQHYETNSRILQRRSLPLISVPGQEIPRDGLLSIWAHVYLALRYAGCSSTPTTCGLYLPAQKCTTLIRSSMTSPRCQDSSWSCEQNPSMPGHW